MKRRTLRRGGYLAAAMTLTAVTVNPISTTHPVHAQDIRTPSQTTPGRPIPVVDLQTAVIQTSAIVQGPFVDGRDLGSIEAGKLADLVTPDRDPLQNIKNTTANAFVMKDGRLDNGNTLDEVGPRERKLPKM